MSLSWYKKRVFTTLKQGDIMTFSKRKPFEGHTFIPGAMFFLIVTGLFIDDTPDPHRQKLYDNLRRQPPGTMVYVETSKQSGEYQKVSPAQENGIRLRPLTQTGGGKEVFIVSAQSDFLGSVRSITPLPSNDDQQLEKPHPIDFSKEERVASSSGEN
jgi:hypothetical protein